MFISPCFDLCSIGVLSGIVTCTGAWSNYHSDCDGGGRINNDTARQKKLESIARIGAARKAKAQLTTNDEAQEARLGAVEFDGSVEDGKHIVIQYDD